MELHHRRNWPGMSTRQGQSASVRFVIASQAWQSKNPAALIFTLKF
jgi:hypothetical protein